MQDTLVSYCIAGDTIPLPNDNLQYAIEQTYDVKISPRIAPLGSSLLRGLFEKYHHGSTIYIDNELNSAWNRYVFAKEACHHLLSGDEFLTIDLTKVIKTIVLDDPEFNGSTTPDSDVQSGINACLSGCNPHPLYVGCAVIRQARVSEWKLMF